MKTIILILSFISLSALAAPKSKRSALTEANQARAITIEVLNACSFSWAPPDGPAHSDFLKSLKLHVAQLTQSWCATPPSDFALNPAPQRVVDLSIKNAEMALIATDCVNEVYSRYASFLSQDNRLALVSPTILFLERQYFSYQMSAKNNECLRSRKLICEDKVPQSRSAFELAVSKCQTYMDFTNIVTAVEAIAAPTDKSLSLVDRVKLAKTQFAERLKNLQKH